MGRRKRKPTKTSKAPQAQDHTQAYNDWLNSTSEADPHDKLRFTVRALFAKLIKPGTVEPDHGGFATKLQELIDGLSEAKCDQSNVNNPIKAKSLYAPRSEQYVLAKEDCIDCKTIPKLFHNSEQIGGRISLTPLNNANISYSGTILQKRTIMDCSPVSPTPPSKPYDEAARPRTIATNYTDENDLTLRFSSPDHIALFRESYAYLPEKFSNLFHYAPHLTTLFSKTTTPEFSLPYQASTLAKTKLFWLSDYLVSAILYGDAELVDIILTTKPEGLSQEQYDLAMREHYHARFTSPLWFALIRLSQKQIEPDSIDNSDLPDHISETIAIIKLLKDHQLGWLDNPVTATFAELFKAPWFINPEKSTSPRVMESMRSELLHCLATMPFIPSIEGNILSKDEINRQAMLSHSLYLYYAAVQLDIGLQSALRLFIEKHPSILDTKKERTKTTLHYASRMVRTCFSLKLDFDIIEYTWRWISSITGFYFDIRQCIGLLFTIGIIHLPSNHYHSHTEPSLLEENTERFEHLLNELIDQRWISYDDFTPEHLMHAISNNLATKYIAYIATHLDSKRQTPRALDNIASGMLMLLYKLSVMNPCNECPLPNILFTLNYIKKHLNTAIQNQGIYKCLLQMRLPLLKLEKSPGAQKAITLLTQIFIEANHLDFAAQFRITGSIEHYAYLINQAYIAISNNKTTQIAFKKAILKEVTCAPLDKSMPALLEQQVDEETPSRYLMWTLCLRDSDMNGTQEILNTENETHQYFVYGLLQYLETINPGLAIRFCRRYKNWTSFAAINGLLPLCNTTITILSELDEDIRSQYFETKKHTAGIIEKINFHVSLANAGDFANIAVYWHMFPADTNDLFNFFATQNQNFNYFYTHYSPYIGEAFQNWFRTKAPKQRFDFLHRALSINKEELHPDIIGNLEHHDPITQALLVNTYLENDYRFTGILSPNTKADIISILIKDKNFSKIDEILSEPTSIEDEHNIELSRLNNDSRLLNTLLSEKSVTCKNVLEALIDYGVNFTANFKSTELEKTLSLILSATHINNDIIDGILSNLEKSEQEAISAHPTFCKELYQTRNHLSALISFDHYINLVVSHTKKGDLDQVKKLVKSQKGRFGLERILSALKTKKDFNKIIYQATENIDAMVYYFIELGYKWDANFLMSKLKKTLKNTALSANTFIRLYPENIKGAILSALPGLIKEHISEPDILQTIVAKCAHATSKKARYHFDSLHAALFPGENEQALSTLHKSAFSKNKTMVDEINRVKYKVLAKKHDKAPILVYATGTHKALLAIKARLNTQHISAYFIGTDENPTLAIIVTSRLYSQCDFTSSKLYTTKNKWDKSRFTATKKPKKVKKVKSPKISTKAPKPTTPKPQSTSQQKKSKKPSAQFFGTVGEATPTAATTAACASNATAHSEFKGFDNYIKPSARKGRNNAAPSVSHSLTLSLQNAMLLSDVLHEHDIVNYGHVLPTTRPEAATSSERDFIFSPASKMVTIQIVNDLINKSPEHFDKKKLKTLRVRLVHAHISKNESNTLTTAAYTFINNLTALLDNPCSTYVNTRRFILSCPFAQEQAACDFKSGLHYHFKALDRIINDIENKHEKAYLNSLSYLEQFDHTPEILAIKYHIAMIGELVSNVGTTADVTQLKSKLGNKQIKRLEKTRLIRNTLFHETKEDQAAIVLSLQQQGEIQSLIRDRKAFINALKPPSKLSAAAAVYEPMGRL